MIHHEYQKEQLGRLHTQKPMDNQRFPQIWYLPQKVVPKPNSSHRPISKESLYHAQNVDQGLLIVSFLKGTLEKNTPSTDSEGLIGGPIPFMTENDHHPFFDPLLQFQEY